MEILVEKNIVFDVINYIIDVKQICEINELYNKLPIIEDFNINTPYKNIDNIIQKIL